VVGKTIDETFVVVHAPLLSGYAAHADTQHTQHKHGCAVAPCSHGVIRWVCCRLEPWPGDRKAKLSPVRPVAFCVLGGVVLCSERGLFGDEDNSSIRDIRRGYSFFLTANGAIESRSGVATCVWGWRGIVCVQWDDYP
jgi:hypothetical protein